MSNLSTDYDVRLATLKKLGGDMSKKYATIYDVDLAILDKIGQGGGGGGSTVWGDIYGDIKDQKDLIDLISQSGGSLTPEQEEAIEKLVNANEGVLITKEIKSLDYYDSYLQNVYSSKYIANEHITPGEAYFVSNQALWKFNYESISFEKIDYYAPHLSDNIVWKDNSGRYYNGNSQIDIETGNQIKVVDGIEGVVQNYNYASTLFKFGNELLNLNIGEIKRFNESTQTFDLMNIGDGSIGDIIPIFIMYYEGDIIAPTYNAKLVKVDDMTYKWESYTAPFETTLPDGKPFDSLNNIHYVEGVGYVYAYGDNNNFYKLVDGHWELFEVHPVGEYQCCMNFNSTYSIGSLIIASFYDRIALVNVGNDYKTTDWSDGTDIFVDLKSEQNIKGIKSFQQITTDVLNSGYINGKSQELTIYAYKNLQLGTSESGKINFNTNRLVKNGVDIATLNDTICNQETKYIGPDYKQVQLENDICTSFQEIVVLNNGRIFSFNHSESYEFVGNTWNSVDFGLGFNYLEAFRTFKITSDKVYFVSIDNGNVYEFTGDAFIQKTSDGSSSYGTIIPLGDTLYDYSTSRKLNTTTWVWENVEVIGNMSGQEPMYYKVINGNTYNFNGSSIYKYNSETNSFEQIIDGYTYDSDFGWFNTVNVFKYESDAYFTNSSGVFKFNTVNNTIERVNIYYNENDNPGYFEYDGKLYVSCACSTGYTYEINYTKPALPNNGLDYSLTAKSTDGKVEYSYAGMWSGTQAEWDALPADVQNSIKIALITE